MWSHRAQPWQEPANQILESGKVLKVLFTYSFVIQPEGKPGHDDDHEARNVYGDDIEGELPGEDQVHPETAVGPGGGGDVASLVGGVRHLEAPRQTQVGGKLEGSLALPYVDQVIRRPTVCNVLFGLL